MTTAIREHGSAVAGVVGVREWTDREVLDACGLLTAHARLYPATPHHREYHLQIDSRRAYSRHASPRLVTKVGLELS